MMDLLGHSLKSTLAFSVALHLRRVIIPSLVSGSFVKNLSLYLNIS